MADVPLYWSHMDRIMVVYECQVYIFTQDALTCIWVRTLQNTCVTGYVEIFYMFQHSLTYTQMSLCASNKTTWKENKKYVIKASFNI